MAWLNVPENVNWEYSNAPNTDKKSVDSYDYDTFTDHIAGIVAINANIGKVVLARQKTHPNPGYGEIVYLITGA